MSSDVKCPECGSCEIDFDQARGDASCVDCGTVLEQDAIVNEVGFSEDARGRSNMVGQHVRADGRISYTSMPAYSRQATQLTMMHARQRLRQISSALGLNSHCAEAAERLFRLAVERNFHKGRRMANVCCACLYVVCRTERSPHMLLDFADVLETNVYVLGHTFLKFAQVLCIQLPLIDPSLYIHRFASKLEFGERTNDVAMTALRILARMNRHWLSHGRRPSGLCGAALLCAAGIHGFHRSMVDVSCVVRVGNMSLRKRLVELNSTPAAGMTVAEIDGGGGDDGKEGSLRVEMEGLACDPPAFQRAELRKMEKRQREEDAAAAAKEGEKEGADDTANGKRMRLGDADAGTGQDLEVEKRMEAALASAEMQELEREAHEEQVADGIARKAGVGAEKSVEEGVEKHTEREDADLSDLDDEDAAKYLNTQEEFQRKEVLWTEANKEYLEQQERLETMRRERPEEYKKLRPQRGGRKKKSGVSRKEVEERPVAPVVKKPSKKLNYNALRSLGGRVGTALPPLPPPTPTPRTGS